MNGPLKYIVPLGRKISKLGIWHFSWHYGTFLDDLSLFLSDCFIWKIFCERKQNLVKSHGNWILVASRQMFDIRIMTGDDSNKLLQCWIHHYAKVTYFEKKLFSNVSFPIKILKKILPQNNFFELLKRC